MAPRTGKAPRGKRHVAADGTVEVAGKVANGEGGAYPLQIRPGVWRWRCYYYLPGDPKRRSKIGKTKTEAERLAAEARGAFRAKIGETRFKPTTTVAELTRRFLDQVLLPSARPTSAGEYEKRYRRISASWIGSVAASELTADDVQNWQAEQLKMPGRWGQPISPTSVDNVRGLLRQVFGWAVKLQLLPNNVVGMVPPPRRPASRPRRVLTAEEIGLVVAHAADDRLGAAVAILFTNGWRASEVLGLAWSDVDLDRGIVTVQRACVHPAGGRIQLGSTKTQGAMGDHRLIPAVVLLLRQRLDAQARERAVAGDAAFVHSFGDEAICPIFTTRAGGLVNRQHLGRAVVNVCRSAGIDPTGLGTHGGRRSVITALYADAGLDIGDISRHIGHADSATTAAYVKDLRDRPARVAEVVAGLFDPNRAEPAG